MFSFFFIFAAFWAFGTTIFPIFPYFYARLILDIAVIVSYIGFFILFLSLELMNFAKINVIRTVFFSSIISITTVLIIIDPNYLLTTYLSDFGGYVGRPSILFSVLQLVIVAGISTEYVFTAFRIKKIAETSVQKQQVILFILGISIGLYGMIIASLIRWIINFPALMLLIGAIGMFIMGIGFIRDPDIAFALPFKVQSLTVINTAGANLFTKKFHQSKNISEDLLSGAISGISLLMQELLGVITSLKEVVFGDRIIILDIRKEFGVFIIAQQSSTTLKIALNNFTNHFEQEFSDHLSRSFDLAVFQDANKYVEKYFGFLPGAWKTNK
ncbi:MAG: hypothetical protein EAX96_02840 [Candidatus Lokiarchaeota archaeon]|nr:hypothetical protein [Candidatus Lokiarchaeota archaeon]